MRILAISNLYPPFHAGGYGVLCHRLCDCLLQAGHNVTVLTSVPKDYIPHPGGHQLNGSVHRELVFIETQNPVRVFWNTFRNKMTVSRHIRSLKPDLIYCFGIDGVGYQVYHTAVESGVPSVTVVGDTWLGQAWRDLLRFDSWQALAAGGDSGGRGRRLVKRLIGSMGRRMGLFIGTKPMSARPVHAISSFLVDDLISAGMPWTPFCHLIKYPLCPPFVASNGEPVGLDGSISPCLRVLFVSRMEPLKGPEVAIRGVANAVKFGADVRLTLAGIGADNMISHLHRLAEELEISDRIRWAEAPSQEALVELYRAHDLFVFPSLIVEGLGIVCLEAMACGLPVVATGRGGQMDLVKEGQTGFLFEPGDVAKLSEILCKCASDRGLLEKLSCGAIGMASSYSSQKVREEIEIWMKSALQAGAQQR